MKVKMFKKWIVVACLSLLLTAVAFAQEKRRWNLQDVEIKTVIEEVSRVTGKNFILDPSVTGRITMISSTDLTPDETYQVFLSALQVLGYAAIDNGDVVKIVPDAQLRHIAGSTKGKGDAVVARVIQIKYVSAAQLVPTLRSMVSPNGHLAAYAPSNSLIIADRAANSDRIAAIVAELDVSDAEGMEVIKLAHASASEVVNAVSQMIGSSRRSAEGSTPVTLSADDRTNSVLVSGDRTRRLQIRTLIADLDIAVDSEGQTEVVYLKFQKAEDMVPVLANILDSYAGQNEERGASASRRTDTQAAPVFNMTQGTNSATGGQNAAVREGAGFVIGSYGVQAEPNLNALILTAPPTVMRNMRSVIARLDVRRAQVLVEAIIIEVTGNQADEWGLELRGAGALAGGTSFPTESYPGGLLNTYQNNLDEGLSTLPGSGLTLGFIRGGSLRALLHALESDSSVNVLSTPSLVAMDNVAAEIKIGKGIPFPIGEYATTGGVNTVTPFITVEYRDVGLSLKVTPQITSGEAIQLQIVQKVDSVGPLVMDLPTTFNREVATQVMIDDGDILVLGGLIQTEDRKSISRVPYLGSMPILGKLFQAEVNRTEKTNLMIFMRPVIMRDRSTNSIVTGSKYNNIRNVQILADQVENYEAINDVTVPPWEYSDIALPRPFNDN
jgi:general secretion pathway protein D